MRVTTPDLRITTVEYLVPGEVFVDPADERRRTVDRDTKKQYKPGYLVIVEDKP